MQLGWGYLAETSVPLFGILDLNYVQKYSCVIQHKKRVLIYEIPGNK